MRGHILHSTSEQQDNVFLEDWEPDVIPLGQPPTVAIVDAATTTDATDIPSGTILCIGRRTCSQGPCS